MPCADKMAIRASQAVITNFDVPSGAQEIAAGDETIVADRHRRAFAITLIDIDPGTLGNDRVVTDAHPLPAQHLHAFVDQAMGADVAAAKVIRLSDFTAAIPPAQGASRAVVDGRGRHE